ncbi:hypothetical protein TNCT_296021 [Trichonephila clavata]|uniref:Uncharacterized protein n=1 Tax=Trichonephila clavata TaxID=2740835 RepID=A0A8X6GHW5_TRICU|nr:hypothetical protein TNCT_296021 [Trichonephila clavata]
MAQYGIGSLGVTIRAFCEDGTFCEQNEVRILIQCSYVACVRGNYTRLMPLSGGKSRSAVSSICAFSGKINLPIAGQLRPGEIIPSLKLCPDPGAI